MENLAEHFGTGSKNILGPHPPPQQHYRTPSQSRLLHYCTQGITGNNKKHKEAMYIQVKYTSLSRNLANINCPTSGTISCKTLQLFNLNETSFSSLSPLKDLPTALYPPTTVKVHKHLFGMYYMLGCHSYTHHTLHLPAHPLYHTPLLLHFSKVHLFIYVV